MFAPLYRKGIRALMWCKTSRRSLPHSILRSLFPRLPKGCKKGAKEWTGNPGVLRCTYTQLNTHMEPDRAPCSQLCSVQMNVQTSIRHWRGYRGPSGTPFEAKLPLKELGWYHANLPLALYHSRMEMTSAAWPQWTRFVTRKGQSTNTDESSVKQLLSSEGFLPQDLFPFL